MQGRTGHPHSHKSLVPLLMSSFKFGSATAQHSDFNHRSARSAGQLRGHLERAAEVPEAHHRACPGIGLKLASCIPHSCVPKTLHQTHAKYSAKHSEPAQALRGFRQAHNETSPSFTLLACFGIRLQRRAKFRSAPQALVCQCALASAGDNVFSASCAAPAHRTRVEAGSARVQQAGRLSDSSAFRFGGSRQCLTQGAWLACCSMIPACCGQESCRVAAKLDQEPGHARISQEPVLMNCASCDACGVTGTEPFT